MKLSAVNNIHFTRKTEAANNIARPLLQANNYQSCDTVSFGMASILQKELYSFNKKNYYFTPDRNGDLPIHGADAKKTKVILDAYKDDKEGLDKMCFATNGDGYLPIYGADAKKTKVILDAYKDDKEGLDKMCLTPNRKGNLPIYGADAEKTKVILDAYKDDKEGLDKMCLFTSDWKNDLPIHLASPEKTKLILDAYKDDKEGRDRMCLTPNKYGYLPIHLAGPEKTKVILDAYKDDKETLAKMLLKINENGLQNKYELVIKTVEKLVFETSEISYKDSLELAKLYADKSERLKAAIPFLESKVETSR